MPTSLEKNLPKTPSPDIVCVIFRVKKAFIEWSFYDLGLRTVEYSSFSSISNIYEKAGPSTKAKSHGKARS